ncbi:hypothetical protein LMG27177_04888 [Paraburkholderia fynbosensis]|uniref:Uncharacterized protein n=1 Tax=Paraburkholderia fynbosensis TaxID=1200993 RepID=A0A6J5GKN2_9BURK|nr:hypothetical protein LMG27177_04888 [Paraburkholderia fynbosensis]
MKLGFLIVPSGFTIAPPPIAAATPDSWLTFTASVLLVPAAMLTIWLCLLALPTETTLARSAIASEPIATLFAALTVALTPSAKPPVAACLTNEL